jgi:TRAP-type transport system periplasmic protein
MVEFPPPKRLTLQREGCFMKRITILLSLCFLVSTVFIAAGVLPGRAEPIKLTYSNFFPPSHIQSKLADEWCKAVQKRTQGRVVVEYFPGQTLTKAAQVYDGVVNGLSDIGFSVLGYTRGRFPLMAAVDLPLGYPNGMAATMVANGVYQKFKPKELQDTQVMYLHAHGPGFVNTRTKAVHTLEDMKGLKIRAHGTSAKVVTALGGTPVAMPMPETYQALQKGVVDGAMYPLEANKGWKLGEVVKFTTGNYSSSYTTTFFVVMNKEKWNSISPKDQKIIEEINKEWIPKHGKAWDTSDAEGLKFLKSKGGKFIKQTPEESARWKKAVQPVITEYITEEAAKKGINGKAVVDYAVSILDKYKK